MPASMLSSDLRSPHIQVMMIHTDTNVNFSVHKVEKLIFGPKMYEMAILTTEFERFEFSRIFSLLVLPDIKCGKIQIEIPKM